MVDKYKNRYRIKSTRLQNWDYGWNGAYFITICNYNRENYFGKIENGQIQLSNIGVIANILWYEMKNHAINIELGEFIIMPNHIHGILILNGDNNANNANNGNNGNNGNNVETGHALSLPQSAQSDSLQKNKTIGHNRFQNIGKNTVSSIIGGYKSAVTKHAHRLNFIFKWQYNYWEHIIRNENEYNRISQYIIDNPTKWENDKLNGGKGNIVMEPSAEYNYENWMML